MSKVVVIDASGVYGIVKGMPAELELPAHPARRPGLYRFFYCTEVGLDE